MDSTIRRWEPLSETSSRGPSGYLRILTRRYVLPDERISSWDLVDGGNTIAVLALTDDEHVVLVRQFRPGPGMILDEMPGGYVESGDTPAEAARKELLEETGYAGEIHIIGSTWLSASATTRRHVAVARNCRRVGSPAPVGDEFCEPVLISLTRFRQHLREGSMTDVDLGYLALDHLNLL
ncbi:NUDIX hydrolase [Nonomuraea purpurea]|uniref:NUDIX hydrolase n=1 Tax=Nonomuraea purpurea TaxID=1849276 RepID=A0ABV8G9W4_9ACTN